MNTKKGIFKIVGMDLRVEIRIILDEVKKVFRQTLFILKGD